MKHSDVLRLLYPHTHEYRLHFEALPIIALIGIRFLYTDIHNGACIRALTQDRELNAEEYSRFKEGLPQNRIFITSTLLTLFGYRPGVRGGSKQVYRAEIKRFIATEHAHIKYESHRSFHKKLNTMSVGRFSFLLCLGAFFIKYAYRDVRAVLEGYAKRLDQIEKQCCPVCFTKYLLNGAKAVFWTNDTSFAGERDLLTSHAGQYMDFIARKAGMKGDRLDTMCAMAVEGMRVELRKEDEYVVQQKKDRAVRNTGVNQLGLYTSP